MGMIIREMVRVQYYLTRKFSMRTKNLWEDIVRKSHRTSLKKFIEDQSDIVEVILKNTEITRDHLTPELQLFLLTENCPLYYTPFIDKNENERFDSFTRHTFRDPFWSIYWPGGQVLTRFILDEKESILGCTMKNTRKDALKILDLGAGCGATAIAAKSIGMQEVVANDINKVACVAIAMNAILNNLDIKISCRNFLEQLPDHPYNVVFVGDLLYDEEIANTLIPWLENSYKQGAQIYIGDPGRHGLTENLKKRLRLLRQYPLPENIKKENYGYDTGTVWKFVCI